jgi:predicted ATPase
MARLDRVGAAKPVAQLSATLGRDFSYAVLQPELLAHHYTEAGLGAQALPYWHRAGQQAIERSANLEAISHLRTGLAVLHTLPETPALAPGL